MGNDDLVGKIVSYLVHFNILSCQLFCIVGLALFNAAMCPYFIGVCVIISVCFVQQHSSVCLQIAAALCITNLIDKNEDGEHFSILRHVTVNC